MNSDYSDYQKLNGKAGTFIYVPPSVILNKNMDVKRVIAYLFFAIKHGLDNEIDFTINSMVSWCGFIPNKNKGKINDKFKELIVQLCDCGFISCEDLVLDNERSYAHEYKKDYHTAVYNYDVVNEECNDAYKRFAILWLDEIESIMNYKSEEANRYLNSSTILLVFAYLRMRIYRRATNVSYEEFINGAVYNPEAYNDFYYKIADEIGISVKTLSSILNILSEDLKLIYVNKMPAIKYDDKFRTDHTVFANTYKRYGCYLIADGEDYYMNEIKHKINRMQKYMKGET